MAKPSGNVEDRDSLGAGLGAARIDRRPGTKRGSPEWRARCSRGQVRRWELEKRKASTVPEWWRLLRLGVVSDAMAPHVRASIEHAMAIETDLGDLSAQKRGLLRHSAHLDAAISAVAHEIAVSSSPDPELCSRLGTLVATYRAQLVALGLDRFEREIESLVPEVVRPVNGAGATITATPEPQVEPTPNLATQGE